MKKLLALLAACTLLLCACSKQETTSYDEPLLETSVASVPEESSSVPESQPEESEPEPEPEGLVDTTGWQRSTARMNGTTITMLLPEGMYLAEQGGYVEIYLEPEFMGYYGLDPEVSKLGYFMQFADDPYERLNATTIGYDGGEILGYVEYTFADTLVPGTFYEYDGYTIFAVPPDGIANFDYLNIINEENDITLVWFDLFGPSSAWSGKDGLLAYTCTMLENLTYS